jgi:hypothetical protein
MKARFWPSDHASTPSINERKIITRGEDSDQRVNLLLFAFCFFAAIFGNE